MLVKLLDSLRRQFLHIFFTAEVKATRRTGLDAGRFEPRAYTIRTQRALVDFLRLWIELGNIKGTAGNAVLASDAVILLEIDDAVGVLNDCSIRRACAQTARIGAMQAPILTHQPLERAVLVGVFVKTDQIVVIPCQIRH